MMDIHSYTLKSIMSVIPLVEQHLSEMVALGQYLDDLQKFSKAWVETDYCRECLKRHSGEISGFALECIRATCEPVSAWRDLHNLGSEMYDFFEGKSRIEDYTRQTFEEAQQFLTRLRNTRKRLTEASEEHITYL